MKHIHFIVNPVSGSGTQPIHQKFLKRFFDEKHYVVVVKYSDYKKHAIGLTKSSIAEGADIIVACGGDGTINEVASCLVNTTIVLGIIPLGSGNGLASNLKIPIRIEHAIDLIKTASVKTIDVGCVNEHYFFSNTGIGIDAQVIRHYENSNERKLFSYLKSSFKALKSLKYKNKITVEINGEKIQTYPFLLFISNSNEMGYKISLTPMASLHDGLLDVLIVPKMTFLKVFYFGFLILLKKPHLIKEAKRYQSKSIRIHQADDTVYESQIDGEFYSIKSDTINITLLKKSLHVIY
ncbi:diacylglycerol/lipid kinase family protein [Gelidibacter maritimus]|uniref:YegS/Rv2252/BmrU family lipid kinase n=1 Tax=Gelidibacter maritimus TaxID=2761487 RepID=A0A7W2R3L0_9FLAO|nr:YegS/Rv2252/BmrU family lipid kinase [Gelidibacter maritimus]MBA6152743.1 YegS/Rv2252/BmrU family lipid kinase [Gelidibacter maritimus]